MKEKKTIFTVSLLKLNKTANFFSFKGTSSQSCAIAGCKNTCGTAAKCIKSLKGLYEIDDQWVHLHNTEVETLKVCNVHYNRDQRRHQKFSGPRHALTNMTCLSCSKSVKTTQAFPCNQHLIGLPNDGTSVNCAVSCCFFAECSPQNSKVIENEYLYTSDNVSSATCFICMDCKGPFVELIKKRKAYEGQQEMVRGLLEGKLNEEKSKNQGKASKVHQIKPEEVLESILEATKEEEDFFVGFGDKKSTLSLSKKTFINGLATSNKKLIVHFLKDSVIAKQIALGQIIKTQYLVHPHKKISLTSLTEEILSQYNSLQVLPICHGVFEEQWVSACEEYNHKNKYQNGKRMFHVDVSHTLKNPKQKMSTINKTVRSTDFNGSKCKVVLPSSNTQLRCEPCNNLLRQCIRKLPKKDVFSRDLTSAHSPTKLTSLDHQQLISRCRNMAEYIGTLRKINSRLHSCLSKEKKKENLMELPKNVNLTASNLTSLIDLALTKDYLKKESVLHALLCDTVTSLLKAESEKTTNTECNKKTHPKGMRFHPVVLKWCVELANRCGKGGYNLVREILPIPCMTTVNAYRQSSKSYDPISVENLQAFSQELDRRNCKGIGGIHWDEIYIKKGIKVCARTNELIGFEDFNIPGSLTEAIKDMESSSNICNNESSETYISTSETDISSEENCCSDEEGPVIQEAKPLAKIILQFFWSSIEGDFTWPVASFPLHKINSKILSGCVWRTIQELSQTKFGKGKEKTVQVLYGVCDGATHSSAFFNQQGPVNWTADNPHNDNKPIFWLSDPPHMIKKLRNFLISQKRHLTNKGFDISLLHLMDVAERGLTKMSFKHLFLTSRNKMSVKRAVETCCNEVADDIMSNSKFGFQETLMTREYIRKAAQYFKIMNSISLEKNALRQLLQVLLFFKRWFSYIQDSSKGQKNNLKEHWKQFISKHTYKDLIRSIRGFIGLVSYLQINHQDIAIVPRTTNQDDVENYFSLQRSRISGGELTVKAYMEGNASIATDMLVKAEKQEATKETFIGSVFFFVSSLMTQQFNKYTTDQ